MKKKSAVIISCILSILSVVTSISVFLLQLKMNMQDKEVPGGKEVIGSKGGMTSLFITTPFGTITTYPVIIYLITLLICITTVVLIVKWKKKHEENN